jgi:cytochrome c oxidase subunit 3
MATLTQPATGAPPPIVPRPPYGSGGNGGNGNSGNNGNSDSGTSDSGTTVRIAIYIGMCASTMTFTALLCAMAIRRGLNPIDWHRLPVPPLLWWNTLALVLSSVALDIGRRAFRAGRRAEFRVLWLTGTALGTFFLVGQAITWKFLSDRGFYMQHNPASAFFYVLTWAHAAHVVGAIGALYFIAWRMQWFPIAPLNRNVVEVGTIFWHFLDIMWLILMAVFAFWA